MSYKEYWIITRDNGTIYNPTMVLESKKQEEEIVSMIKRDQDPDSIHVIEHAALEAEKQKIDAVLKYCEGNTEIMWAATIVGILLNCEFRDAKAALAKYRGSE
jgi:hypothetical protein